jgi:hypothetical protein
MKTQLLKNIKNVYGLKLTLVLVVILYFALQGFPSNPAIWNKDVKAVNLTENGDNDGTPVNDNLKSNLPLVRISGTYTQGDYTDETVVFFIAIATNTFNPKTDAHKLMNTEPTIPNIYTIKDEQKLSIDAYPEITDGLVIPVGYDVHLPGTYIISAKQIANIDTTNVRIYLEDLALNVTQDLVSLPNYTFNINPTDKGGRFFLRFSLLETATEKIAKPTTTLTYANANMLYVSNNNANGEKCSVAVYNVQGQRVFEANNLSTGQHKFSINQNPGCYFVRTTSVNSSDIKKVYIY